MNPSRIFLPYLVGLLMISCSHDEAETIVPTPSEPTTTPISWSVLPIQGMQGSRALVNNDGDLRNACSQEKGESIGIWGDYDLTINGEKRTIEGFLDDVKLVFYGISGNEDSPTGWDYQTEDQYWELGGKYRFRAYYPQKALYEKDPTAILPTSNATTYMINYRTALLQEDLLVAY